MYRLPVSWEMNLRLSCWTKYGYSLKIHANVSSETQRKTVQLRVHCRSLKARLISTCSIRYINLFDWDSWTERNIPCCGLKMLVVSLGRDTMANVIAISAEEMGDLRKGSETKWITARQWPSPDTWPPFLGSLSDSGGSREARANGRMGWRMDGLTYGSRNMFRCPFTSGGSTIRKEKPARVNYCVILRSTHCTDSQERGDALRNLPPQRWGAPSQKVYAMTANHIRCAQRERVSRLWMGSSVRAGCSDADTKRFLIRQAWATQSQHNLHLNWVTVMSSDRILPNNRKSSKNW